MTLPHDVARCNGHRWANKLVAQCEGCDRRKLVNLPAMRAPKFINGICPERIENEIHGD